MKLKVSNYKFEYSLVTGAVLFYSVVAAIFLISFRTIGYKGEESYGGTDAPAYKSIYELANTDYASSLLVQFYEPGYASLVWFFSRFVGGYEYYQIFLYTLLYLSLLIFSRKLRPSFYVLVTLFFLNSMLVSSLNVLRVTVAVFVSLHIFYFLNSRKYFKAILISLIASSIHTSAVILFPMIFMCYIFDRYSLKVYFATQFFILALFCFFSLYLLPVFISGTRLDDYTTFNKGAFSFNTFAVALIIIFLVFNRYRQMITYNSFNRSLISSLPTIFFVLPIFYNYSIGYRFLLFYLPVMFALLPSVFYIYRFRNKCNLLFSPLIFVLYFYFLLKVFNFFASELEHSEIYELNNSFDFINISGFL